MTETEKGQSVFYLIEKFHDVHDGYAGGQFYKEWEALTKRYEEVESKSLADLKEDYYGAKMTMDQQPSLFVVKMERMKIKMKEKGFKISEEDFINDVLSKLPESKDPKSMNPYQIKKLFIKEKMTSGYTLDDMTTDLEKTYVEDVEDKIEKSTQNAEGEKAFYTPGKTFKGKCNKCGKMGHKGRDCRSSNYKKNPGKGGSNDNEKKKKFTGDCYHCGKPGHTKAQCWKLHGKPNGKKAESANTVRDKGEVAFTCLPIQHGKKGSNPEPSMMGKKLEYSFRPVDNTIDDEGYPVPDSFFDLFSGSSDEDKTIDDEDTAYFTAPEWDEPKAEEEEEEELFRTNNEAKCEEAWIEVKHKKLARCEKKKGLSVR